MGKQEAKTLPRVEVKIMLLRQVYRTPHLGAVATTKDLGGSPAIWQANAPTRVKRCATPETHRNSPLSIERLPEITAEMREASPHLTASLRPQEN